MFDLPVGESRTSGSIRFVTTCNDSRVEMGVEHYIDEIAHFIPDRSDYSLEKLAKLYVVEIVILHSVPLSIISYHDPIFTSRFCGKLHEAFGSKFNLSIAFHMQIDGQFERLSNEHKNGIVRGFIWSEIQKPIVLV
ncbi:integrase [Gossypium australe]|uniref:Integrase n=1 Tax=Gossypium australe TaxID=47621 RepID=A0A5B6VM00_9ROSI|nr:integrase [Gossypium australe]